MPQILYIYGYKLFFWSNENGEPIHFHISKGNSFKDSTKVWVLSNNYLLLAHNKSRYPKKDLSKLFDYIYNNPDILNKIKFLWHEKFGYISYYK